MVKLAMLGSGFIGRFYADSIQGLRSKDKIVSIYSRRESQAKKFADDYGCDQYTTDMEAAISNPDVDMVCISLPNNLHEEAVMLCCKHKKAVITTKPLGRNAMEAKRMLEAVETALLRHRPDWVLVYGDTIHLNRVLAGNKTCWQINGSSKATIGIGGESAQQHWR